MTLEELSTASGPQLIERLKAVELEVEKVREAYLLAADRECKVQLREIRWINFEFRKRGACT
jgi:hypothetical protein